MSRLTNQLKKLEQRLQKEYLTLNRIEVSRTALLHNFDLLEGLNPNFKIIPVLKSNAYGHGLQEVTEVLKTRQFPYIAVDGYFEALRIRQHSDQPVLIMGAIHPTNYTKLKFKNFIFVVGDRKQLEAIGALKKRLNIHLDINTGMNRQGIQPTELPRILKLVQKSKKLNLEGVMSHLADADNPVGDGYTIRQSQLFDKLVSLVLDAGFKPSYIHLANSPGSPKVRSQFCNTIRPGIALYGINPLAKTDLQFKKLQQLKPALTFWSTIVKEIPLRRGDRVSYNGIFSAPHGMRVAVLPVGYYEGLPRELSNRGWVKYGQNLLPVVGRVCMNHTIVNIGDSRAKLWDEVVVISNDPNDRNSIARICEDNKLFNYSLVTGLSNDVRRVLVD